MSDQVFAIVTKARGTFFKPLYEAFAAAQPSGWRTALFWPAEHQSEHPEETYTPRHEKLEIVPVSSARKSLDANDAGMEGRASKYQTYLPSRELWRALKSRNVRAMLIHEFSPYTLQALAYARWKGVPVVVSTEVGKANGHFFGSRTRWWHALWGQFVQGVAACCPAAHQPLSGKSVPTVSTYHAVDSRLYVPETRGEAAGEARPVNFVYLGQLIRRKGLDLLLNAASQLKAEGIRDFQVTLIGGGDSAWVLQESERLGLQEHLTLTGFLSGPAIRKALAGGDAFVLPTRQDTYAAVVHEAACLALPLLISKHAGAAEALVRPGENGFIVDPEDTADFAGKLKALMDPALRKKMSAVSREIGVEHSAHLRGAALWQWVEQHFAPSAPLQ